MVIFIKLIYIFIKQYIYIFFRVKHNCVSMLMLNSCDN